jgi:hypothetical protein
LGYSCVFGGSSGSYAQSPNFAPPSATSLSIFTNLILNALPGSGNHGYILFCGNSFELFIDSSGKVNFKVYNSSTPYTLVSTGAIPTDGNYHTIAAVWDGTNLDIYIDDALDSSAAASFGSYDNSGSQPLIIGNNGSGPTTYLQATVDTLEVRSSALAATDVDSLCNQPGGNLYTVYNHNFALGDLIGDDIRAFTGCVTGVVDNQHFYAYPFAPMTAGALYRYGNIYNTNRQALMEIDNNFDGNGSPQIRIKNGISNWAQYASPPTVQTWDPRGESDAIFIFNVQSGSSYSVQPSDFNGYTIIKLTYSGPPTSISIQMPNPGLGGGIPIGVPLVIKCAVTNASVSNVALMPFGTEQIEGVNANYTANNPDTDGALVHIRIVSDGANWLIL